MDGRLWGTYDPLLCLWHAWAIKVEKEAEVLPPQSLRKTNFCALKLSGLMAFRASSINYCWLTCRNNYISPFGMHVLFIESSCLSCSFVKIFGVAPWKFSFLHAKQGKQCASFVGTFVQDTHTYVEGLIALVHHVVITSVSKRLGLRYKDEWHPHGLVPIHKNVSLLSL